MQPGRPRRANPKCVMALPRLANGMVRLPELDPGSRCCRRYRSATSGNRSKTLRSYVWRAPAVSPSGSASWRPASGCEPERSGRPTPNCPFFKWPGEEIRGVFLHRQLPRAQIAALREKTIGIPAWKISSATPIRPCRRLDSAAMNVATR